MTRMTIALPDDRASALREMAARTGRTVAELVDAALAAYGVPAAADPLIDILKRAGRQSGLDDDAAMALAVAETRAHRAGR